MEYTAYYVIHEKMQSWINSQKKIRRKKLIDFLKYFHIKTFNWRTKYLIINDLVELGLLKKINGDEYEWLPSKKTKEINENKYINLSLLKSLKKK